MSISSIQTEEEYDEALKEIEKYFDNPPEPGTPEADKFNSLSILIFDYEIKHWPIDI